MKRIAILASGNGSNARAIIQYFHLNPGVKIESILCNNPKAKVIDVATEFQVPYYLITKKDLYETDHVLNLFENSAIDLIVLAGFLWLVPEKILHAFPKKIINIHPALLPKYGGSNMYGQRVHEAVFNAHDIVTGITIHYLSEQYDEGEIIFQKTCPVNESDTIETIAKKVQELEHEWYPRIIEKLLSPLSSGT
jgi:phosphoribosylglycinamide formyltransferase-1